MFLQMVPLVLPLSVNGDELQMHLMPHLRHDFAPGLGASYDYMIDREKVSMTSYQPQLLMVMCVVLYTNSLASGFTCYFLLLFSAPCYPVDIKVLSKNHTFALFSIR